MKKIEEKKSKVKEVPEDFGSENITQSFVELTWAPVIVKGKEVKYQVVSKRRNAPNRDAMDSYSGTATRCIVDGLEQKTEYEFRLRCGYGSGWGKWTESITLKTKDIPIPVNFYCVHRVVGHDQLYMGLDHSK